ncbi:MULTISPECIES: molybdopterin molybdotransferase MoeA [unclassified Cellulophaga]|uniref:molybdopterin molybdotransferase MoeA n=1 Tax=unclassified Cellulophaga TaxID=2634405 RepID=UPI0026E2D2A3|nr:MULTISPECIES: molybdopterin molybdotransferase MoeA [unclassified Cellulophaga]MDO6491662.1 molybdopterin molybdotransferase MoeA [Cellulophaga sp. 2_MG-2023]MDO6493539.1 molybdopterin molybdotransferase MoeA [Cellulophaga sp. 3_MG-2023]
MITFKEAYTKVLEHSVDYGVEQLPLKDAVGRVLAIDVSADRDFPPFNRSTKDGIALSYEAIEKGQNSFKIEAVIAAGNPTIELQETTSCVEIMTGAVVPNSTDVVVMYEDINIENGVAKLQKAPVQGQNIHIQGSDKLKGAIVLHKNTLITAAEIGVLSAVGEAQVSVKKLPKITTIATGNELVEVTEKPLAYQIRKSNINSLYAALLNEQIIAKSLHLKDSKEDLKRELEIALQTNDVLLLSGGVSKGKFDYLPVVLEELGVEKVFHKVLQKPGKPFWFGVHKATNTVIFSFPGNPASTFANYHIYFKPWLQKSLGLTVANNYVILNEELYNKGSLTLFLRAKISFDNGKLLANRIVENGSGDLTSLANCDGFICVAPKQDVYSKGSLLPFIQTRRLF